MPLPRKMQHSATWKSASAAPMALGTKRNGCDVTSPYVVHSMPLSTFMVQMGAWMDAALRVRNTCGAHGASSLQMFRNFAS